MNSDPRVFDLYYRDETFVDQIGRIDSYLNFPVFFLSILMLVLTVFTVSHKLARYYCASVAVPSFLTSLINILVRLLSTKDNHTHNPCSSICYLETAYMFLRAYSQHTYIYFSALTVFLAYVGYAWPLKFKGFITGRALFYWFSFGFLLSIVMNVFAHAHLFLVDTFHLFTEFYNFKVVMIIQTAFSIALYVFVLFFYVLTIIKIKKVKNVSQSNNWKVLKSILLYCSPPNLFIALAISAYVCDDVLEVQGLNQIVNWPCEEAFYEWIDGGDNCSHIRVWSQAATNFRLLVTLLTAFLAFREYRVGLRSLVKNATSKVTFLKKRLFRENCMTVVSIISR